MSEMTNIEIVFPDPIISTIEIARIGPAGNPGQDGIDGQDGADSTVPGPAGQDGQGVPTGGDAGQVLAKIDGVDFNSEWIEPPSGGSSYDQDLNTTDNVQFVSLNVQDGTNPTELTVHNTYTDASNYERGFMRWNANVLEIGAEADGTGVVRDVVFEAKNLTVKATEFDFIGSRVILGYRVAFAGGEEIRRASSGYLDFMLWDNSLIGIRASKINQRTESTADPSTTDYPNDKDSGTHLNTTTGKLYTCHNYGGTIYKTELT